jgi:hypothetical protein
MMMCDRVPSRNRPDHNPAPQPRADPHSALVGEQGACPGVGSSYLGFGCHVRLRPKDSKAFLSCLLRPSYYLALARAISLPSLCLQLRWGFGNTNPPAHLRFGHPLPSFEGNNSRPRSPAKSMENRPRGSAHRRRTKCGAVQVLPSGPPACFRSRVKGLYHPQEKAHEPPRSVGF